MGSVRSLGDASGSLINKYDYTAFGEAYAANTVEKLANRYTYTGREKSSLASAGAPMYYRNRMYSPRIGRLLRIDPAGYPNNPDGNLYAYCSNSALMMSDPWGLGKFGAAVRIGKWGLKIFKKKMNKDTAKRMLKKQKKDIIGSEKATKNIVKEKGKKPL